MFKNFCILKFYHQTKIKGIERQILDLHRSNLEVIKINRIPIETHEILKIVKIQKK